MKRILMVLFVIAALIFSTVLAFAATDYGVTIVSPANKSEISANSLLISIKVTQPCKMNVSVFEEKRESNGTQVPILAADWKKADNIKTKSVTYMKKEAFSCANNLSFYTKQLNDVSPGTYRVQAEVLGADGKTVVYSTYSLVVVTDQATTEKIFETSQSGTMQFLQNLLKSIFGDD